MEKEKDYSDLDSRFTKFHESGERVEVTWKPGFEDYTGYGCHTEGLKARFYVGRSTGWKPIYLMILQKNSIGGGAILSCAVKSIRGLGIFESSTFLQAGLNSSATQANAKVGVSGTGSDVGAVRTNPVNVSEAVTARRFMLNENSTVFKNAEFTTYFFSDGARRFFVRFDPSDSSIFSSLKQLPFDADEWGATSANADSDLSTITRIHWIENISGSGQLMAGIDTGVIVLE